MKRILSALTLAVLAAPASAFDLIVTTVDMALPVAPFDVVITGFNPATAVPNGRIGSLAITGGSAEVTYTYLGKEAGYSNGFFNPGGSVPSILDTAPVLTTSTQWNVSGLLNFSFNTFGTTTVLNGGAGASEPTFAIFDGAGTAYKFIIGYSDGGAGSDHDYDDMVFGVNAAIPEPQTYALLLAGLGVIGFVARRRLPRAS
jgi:PEP-CTERM motif